MSSYVSEQNKWEEFKKKKAGTQAEKQGNTASNSSSEQEKWEAFKKQKASGIDSSYISSFLNDSQKFTQDRSSGLNQWFDTSADTWDADSSDYSNRSRRIRAYLRTSSNPYDEETTANLNAYLDAFDENLKSLGSSHRKAVELYSQFDSQESYDTYLQGLKDKQAMLELDTKAAQADLENLQKNVTEYTELDNWYKSNRTGMDNENVTDPRIRQMLDRHSELQDWFAAEYGGTDDLKNIVSEKSAYLNTAKRLQGNAAFTTVNDPTSEHYDPEFQNYTAPKVTLPTREELAAYDTMMDQSQWRAGTNEDLYDAYGNAIDPYNKDANGNIIHPKQGTVDVSDKLGIFRAATEEEISEATGTYLSTGGTWENILAEGSQRYWNRMTDDEINTYYYHLNKGGAEAAAQYLDTIQETLNYREGRARYDEIQGQTGKEILFGIAAGLSQSAIAAGGSRNTGSAGSKYIPASAVQVTGQLAREGLADDSIPMWYNFKEGKWEDKIFGSSAGQMAYDMLSTTANMAPSILVSTAVGMLNPTAGQIAGAAVMGIGAGGNAYQEKINAGYTEEEARSYGLMIGASETVLEYALGGIGKLGKNVLTKTVLKNLDAVDNVFARFAKSAGGKILLNASSEAIEEGLQSVIEPYLWQAVSGEEATVDMQEALYSALMGFATGGLFESTEAVNSGINQQIQYRDMGSQLIRDGGVDPLKELANEMYGVTEGKTQRQLGRQLAKVEKNATPSRVGKLSSTVQENFPAYQKTRAEQTREALVENMTQKGVDTTRAETVADAIAAAQAGEDLSREQVDTLLSLGEADEREIAAIEEVADLLTQAEELEDIPSADGKVLYKGNLVELAGISSAGGGKLILNLEDGGTADVSELSFPDTGEQELYEAVARYADSAASAEQLLENYRSSDVPAQIYARGIAEAYQYGRMQYTAPQLMQDGVLVQQLHANQTSYAYGLGKASIHRDTARRQQEAARRSSPRKGSVNYGYKGEKVDKSRLNEAQKVVVDFAERLADKKGMTFYFYRSHENADGQWVYKNAAGQEVLAGNGYYDPRDGSIHIDLNAGDEGNAMLSTIAHELTHFIQDWSPEKYRAFCKILMEGYADRGQSVRELVLKKQDEYLRIFGIDLTYEQAYDEVIASSMESVLNDGNVMDLLDQLETADKSLWEKFCSFLEEIADLIHRTVQAFRNVHPESDEGRIVERMTEIHAQLQQAFAEGLHEGGENYHTGGQKNTAENSGVKYSFGVTQADIDNYIEAAYNNSNSKDYVKYAEISERLFDSVSDEIDIAGYAHALRDNDIRHIRNSHGEGTNEKYPITKGDLAKIPDIVMNFDKVYVKSNAAGKPGIVYVKVGSDNVTYYVEAVTEEYHNEKLLVNKQMVKTGIDEIPNLRGLIAAINKKESSSQYLADLQEIRKAYVQDVKENYSDIKVPHDSESVKENSSVDSMGNQLTAAQQKYFADSVARDSDGGLLVLYHQTDGDFTIFDTRHPGAGSRDSSTPFGIFLKRSAGDIGLKGKKQMKLYANITNPLRAANREELTNKLRKISDRYAEVSDKHKMLDAEYHEKFEQAKKAWRDYMVEWRAANPGASRSALYEDAKFNELFDAEDSVIEEWTSAADQLSTQAKEAITEDLRKAGYDGIFLQEDAGSWGRKTDAIIALDPEQVKDTSNKNPTSNPDIRYSARYQQNASAAQLLQQENNRMVEDVAGLTPLVQALRKMNGGKMRTAYLAEAVAFLKSKAGAKGNSAELGSLLSDFYSYMTHNDDYTWEDIRQKAKPVAAWLMDHTVRTKQMSSYARDILDFLRTSRISLDDTQKAEAAYHYGSYDAYRRMLMGSVIVANENAVPLDSKWQELSQLYPDVFPEDTNAADMPEAFLDAIQQLRNSDTSELEYEYNRDFIEQDLILRIYDSFWNASTLNVAADYFGQKIRSMKEKHNRNMSLAYQRHRDALETQRQKYRQQLESLQAHQEERYQRREAEYKESRQKAVERHDKTQMRKRIRKEVESLRRLNERAPKDQRTKEELQTFAQTALKAADAVFLENYNEYAMIRNGVGVELLPEEAELLKECRELLDKLGEVAPVEDKWDLEDTLRFTKENEAIKQELFKKIKPLRDAGIFRREFNRIHNVDAAQLIDELTESYAQLKTTESEYLSGAYQEEVYTQLQNVKESIGAKSVKDMTMQELQQLYEMYHMVLHVIRTANETFAGERAKSVTALGNGVVRELEGRKKQLTSRKIIEDLKKTGWNGLTVAYAFRTIGSDTMQQLYKNLRNGEDVWARDMQEAKDFWQKQADRFKAHDWDMDKRQKFHDSRGNEFSVSLGQLMSLYALSKRQQAWDHLEVGGFMLDNSEHYITNIVDRALPKVSTTAQTYKLTRKDLDAVCSKLTPQQRAFVDATQAYLSTDLAAKGNEVSMKLYGIKLFKEKNYFPLRTASQGRYTSTELIDQNKLKNSGHTKELKPNAKNSVVLSSYSSVWTNHVNQMGLYHGLTLPMEDMDRVLNFGKTIQKDENGNEAEVFEQDSVCTTMQNIFGQHPENYIRELMKQLNGGVRSDDTEQLSTRMLGRFKKAAVAASLSVWIQQWTSMFRAMAYIDPRFFAQMPQLGKQRQAQVDDMKAHCPVAIIKEMGGFDTGMGASVHDFITGRETHNMKEYGRELLKHPIKQMDELAGWLPQRADENTWVRIWIAAKRETLDKHKDLHPGSEEFYKLASDRFNEVITLTQVYDSVMAKSALMRSKGFGAKMLTQFMAEPTIASNMAWDAGVQMVRTGKPQVRTAAALVSSIVVNAMCSSLIYAMRDDDEEETFMEKYAQSFVSNLADGLNPLTYIPIVRDIWSVFQGYDVGRSDMELWSGLSSSLQKLTKKYADENATEKELRDAWWSLTDNVFSLFGIPEKNVRREINAGINVFQTLRKDFSGRTTTGGSMADTAQDAFLSSVPIVGWIKGETKAEKLLDASVAGDAKYVTRLRSTYKTESAANNAVAGAVRDRFEAGELTKAQAIKQLTAYAGKSKEEAADKLVYWQFCLDHPDSELTESSVLQYEQLRSTGISLEVFTRYKELCEGKTKRAEILPIIDSLPLTVEQKDALYFARNYAESTLSEAPWH